MPQAWIDQTRDGGKILVNVLGAWNLFTLVLLTVHGDTTSGGSCASGATSCPGTPTERATTQ